MPKPFTAIIMAAARRGVEDSVAKLQNKTHKCLVEINGKALLVWVIEALRQDPDIGRIFISIEDEAPLHTVPLLSQWLEEGVIKITPSQGNLADSVLSATQNIDAPFPLLITTGDNVLHHGALVQDFTRAALQTSSDIALAFTEATVVRTKAHDVKLAYHRLKDGEYSACNLYALKNTNALRAVRIFESGGQFGKRHLRILKAFGVIPFLLYKSRAVGIHSLISRIAKNLGVSVAVVLLDYVEGPIDVDNPQFFRIAERLLRARTHDAFPAPHSQTFHPSQEPAFD